MEPSTHKALTSNTAFSITIQIFNWEEIGLENLADLRYITLPKEMGAEVIMTVNIRLIRPGR